MLEDAKQSAQKLLMKNKLLFTCCMMFIMISLFLVCYVFFFRSVTIDVTKDMEIVYSGESGSATISITNTSTNINQRTQEFLDSIYYTATPNANLSNGSVIQVTAGYDKDIADKYNIKVINEQIELTVSGLAQRYESVDQISEDFIKTLNAQGESYLERNMDEILKDDFTQFYVTSNTKLVEQKRMYRMFLQAVNKDNKDKIIDIYELKAKGMVNQAEDHEDLVEQEVSIYYVVTYDHINTSEKLRDEAIYGEKLLAEDLTKNENLTKALRQKYLLSYQISVMEGEE